MNFSPSFKRKVRRVLGTIISIAVKFIDYLVVGCQPELEKKGSVSKHPMDPKKPGLPISYPLKTLKDLEDRSYFDSFHYPFNKSSVPLPPHRASKPLENRPRLLVCHDMEGGYLDDKWVQGNENSKAYAIWHWFLIDIFVYFSHDLVTLPPPCWTNTAHRHGVQVLGTFITEWDEGISICKTLLASKESAEMYADRLAELAIELGFDGWLINIEVDKLELEQITHLKEFVDHLTVSMHNSLTGSLVIWYDSVTKDGHLLWQNELNEKNKPFFDICDGIFVNYTWQKNYPKHSALVAGKRQFDVYMGIDVFGRNTYGGGQWTTNLALEVAKEAEVSVAIFAPGWVYQTNQGPSFQDANNRWWGLVGQSWPSSQTYPELFPLFSSFDQGHGKGIYIEGQHVSDRLWNNISCQSLQPLLEVAPDSLKGQLQSFTNFDLAYNGGACITIMGNMEEGTHFMTKLFCGTVGLEKSPLHISYSMKFEDDSRLCLALHLSNSLDAGILIFLTPEGSPTSNTSNYVLQLPDKSCKTAGSNFSNFKVQGSAGLLQVSNDWHLQEYTLEVDSYALTAIYAVSYKGELDGDKVLKILKENKFVPSSLTEVNEHLEKKNAISTGFESSFPVEISERLSYHASLGHITLTSSDHEQNVPQSDSWDFSGNDISWDMTCTGQIMLSTNLVWRLKMGPNCSNVEVDPTFLRYDIYVQKIEKLQAHNLRGNDPVTITVEHLGVAVVESFYVSQLLVPPDCRTLRFFLQVCSSSGDFKPLKDSPSLSISVPSKL